MGFDDGILALDSVNGAYSSGQTVNAKLVFNQNRIETIRGIYAQIKGYCQVHWTSTNTQKALNGRDGYNSELSTEATHESYEVYIERKIYLVGGETGEHRINPGNHEFAFSFPLPANCPSSFEGEYGHIRYEIKVVMDRAFQLSQEKKVSLRVFAPLDLNMDSYCDDPIEMQLKETYYCCCTSSGSCQVFVKLPKGGYCPGQVMPIEVKCTNQSNVEIQHITLSIEQNTSFRASVAPAVKKREDTVATMKVGPIAGDCTRTWTLKMQVPAMDICNVVTCRYINIDYDFKVKVSPEGCHADSTQSRRFVIGNIPLKGYQDSIPNPQKYQEPKVGPYFGPVINQPTPNVSPYPAPSPYHVGNIPYPHANYPYPSAN